MAGSHVKPISHAADETHPTHFPVRRSQTGFSVGHFAFEVHSTQRPIATSHTGPLADPAQFALDRHSTQSRRSRSHEKLAIGHGSSSSKHVSRQRRVVVSQRCLVLQSPFSRQATQTCSEPSHRANGAEQSASARHATHLPMLVSQRSVPHVASLAHGVRARASSLVLASAEPPPASGSGSSNRNVASHASRTGAPPSMHATTTLDARTRFTESSLRAPRPRLSPSRSGDDQGIREQM